MTTRRCGCVILVLFVHPEQYQTSLLFANLMVEEDAVRCAQPENGGDEGRPRIQDGLVVQLTTSDRFFSFEVKTARAER